MMYSEIITAVALIIGISSLIIALNSLFSPAIRSEPKRIKPPGTIEFPQNPKIDDTYTCSGRTWRWNGVAWEIF